jgi:ABC-type transporter Mla maintaining outer membrane lipid asymmetry ATPase subunit MlaF
MKRRVALARALIGEPEIMLYDEPTAGLDPVTSKKINELIIALRDIKNVTGVFVTHRMRDAFTLAIPIRAERRGTGSRFTRKARTFVSRIRGS